MVVMTHWVRRIVLDHADTLTDRNVDDSSCPAAPHHRRNGKMPVHRQSQARSSPHFRGINTIRTAYSQFQDLSSPALRGNAVER